LEINLVDQVTISRNGARNFAAKVNRTSKGLFNGFDCNTKRPIVSNGFKP